MRIHHLNCGSMSPPLTRMEAIVYCLLVETDDGLVLVDTGFGVNDCTRPSGLFRFFASVIGAPLNIEQTAISHVTRLGHQAADVNDIHSYREHQ